MTRTNLRKFNEDDKVAFANMDICYESALISDDVVTVNVLDTPYVGRVIVHGFFVELHLVATKEPPVDELYKCLTIQKECLTKQFAIDLGMSVPDKPSVEWLFVNEFAIV